MNDQRVLDALTVVRRRSTPPIATRWRTVTSLTRTVKAYTAYVDMRIARRANELKGSACVRERVRHPARRNGSARDAKAAENATVPVRTVPGFEDALARRRLRSSMSMSWPG